MSQLPGESLTYRTVVAEYFLAARGAGLMLSPLDEAQVGEWERRGVPVAVVCRGLARGVDEARARAPGVPPPRSLRAYRLAVEDEWRAYRGGRVGEAGPPPDEASAAARRLAEARALADGLAAASTGARRDAYAAAAALLASTGAADLDAVEAALRDADAVLLARWLAALPSRERAALGARCSLRAGPRPPGTRPAAHRSALRAHLVDAAREAGLIPLRGSV